MDSLISPEVVLVSVFGSRCNMSPPALSVPKANFQVSHWASVNKVSLFAKFHAQTNGQTKTANQALCGPIKPAYVEYPAGLARVGTQLQMFSVCIPRTASVVLPPSSIISIAAVAFGETPKQHF